MATGIEYRQVGPLVEYYQEGQYPNFSIWNGPRLCIKYEGSNIDEGYGLLLNYLNNIQQSGTQTIYAIRFYPSGTKNINNKTGYEGSTTFQLTTYLQGGGSVPNVNVNMPAQQTQAQRTALSGTNNNAEVTELRRMNKQLQEKLHNKEIDDIRKDFTNQIAALREESSKKTIWDHIGSLLTDHKDDIKDIIRSVKTNWGEQKDFINKPGGSMSGTNKGEGETEIEIEIPTDMSEKTAEGALINPLISGDELKLTEEEQSKLTFEKIKALDEDTQNGIQSDCLDVLAERIGNGMLTRLILTVACMDNKSLNKLLNHLD